MNDHELWEHIRSLQAQIDHLVDQDDARLRRIARLERDRETLRRQLDEAKKKRRRKPDPPPSTDEPKVEVAVPGVGVIGPGEVRTSNPLRLKVATVLDPISAAVFGPEFDALPLGASTWEEVVEAEQPDLLLVESAFQGVDGSWATRIARFGGPSTHLQRLVSWCRQRSIPTVFWNKEDPANFDWFIESARLFDWVFTVDGDQVPRYQGELGHQRVGLMQFFAQPALHYPGADAPRSGAVAFAGSYYAAKHEGRRAQIETVIDPARQFGLHIFDRHLHTDDPRFSWPAKYQPHIVGSLTYHQTVEAYRRYKVFLNVNTVTGSPTMCARRVFELAASGTPIVTGPAVALTDLARRGVVDVVDDPDEATRALRDLLAGEDLRATRRARGLEWIDDGNHASDRLDRVLTLVGIKATRG